MELGSCLVATLPWEQPGFMHSMDFKQYIYKSKNPMGLKQNIALKGAGRAGGASGLIACP